MAVTLDPWRSGCDTLRKALVCELAGLTPPHGRLLAELRVIVGVTDILVPMGVWSCREAPTLFVLG